MPDGLSIAQVTPHPWGSSNEVNEFVERSSSELASRGHRVLIVAPSDSRTEIRDSRRAIRAAQGQPASLFSRSGRPRVLAVGQSIAVPGGPGPRTAPVPANVSRTVEELLGAVKLDVVHVHEPFAPSVSAAALRHSWSLNVGSFHQPAERILSTQVARPLVEIFFGRLDARTVSSEVTGELLTRYFPGTYELLRPGVDLAEPAIWGPRAANSQGPVRVAFCAQEEKGALRLFLRALRRLSLDGNWEAAVHVEDSLDSVPRVNRKLRERLRVVGPSDGSAASLIAGADIVCMASGGPQPAPALLRQTLAAGAVPIASRLPIYIELTADGERGLLFPVGDAETLAGQLTRLIDQPDLLAQLRGAIQANGGAASWKAVAERLESIYSGLVERRHATGGRPDVRRRVARRRQIEIDLHMHTDHSPDCATPVEVLLETARDRGLGAIAITDHNEISGALEAREVAQRMEGLEVIVAEEVKTAEEGEVIGLFIEEKIERGMTMAETIAEIRRQGGVVYVPHPFDRLHSVPDYEHLLKIVEQIDILEVFNPRVAFSAFNEEAERFAAKYGIVPGAGSDSHVAQGLGSVRIRVHDFEGPEEFMEAMRDADIVRKHKNLIYVQALKFLQTTGRPKAARRARAAKKAKPVRGGQRRERRRRRV